MNEPPIMAWTVMPFKIVAKAWSDSTYLSQLLGSPRSMLQNALWELPWTYSTINIYQDTVTDRHLPLPLFPSQYVYWTQDQVATQLQSETFGDISMQYYLPSKVIARGFFDTSVYKPSLLNTTPGGANAALSDMGNTPPSGVTFWVYENSATTLNLTIPLIPSDWQGLSYKILLERLWAQSNQLWFGKII